MSIVPWQSRDRPHNARWMVWLLLITTTLMIVLYPMAEDYLRAASLLDRIANPHAKGWVADYDVHPVEVHETSFDFRGAKIPARIYTPRGIAFAPGIVVIHGMHELGINEPRLVGFARSLAATGFFVMTPLVPGIADYQVRGESADLIGTAAQSFAQQLEAPKVGVLALSFSGGLALLAACDPQYSASFAWIATVGAHYDLAHVIRFLATGEAARPDGSWEHLAPHEYGALIVVYDEPQDFFSPENTTAAREAIKLLLSGKGKASEAVTRTMTPSGQQTMQRIYHKQDDALDPAILAQIDARQEQLTAASPAGHLRSLRVPVLLLHGADDSVIPPTEMLWLKRDIPAEELLSAVVSPAISHVEVGSKVSLRDRIALVHWMAVMIHEATVTEGTRRETPLPAGAWLSAERIASYPTVW